MRSYFLLRNLHRRNRHFLSHAFCVNDLFAEKLSEVVKKSGRLFFFDPMSAVVDDAPRYGLCEVLKLLEGSHAHGMISANSPNRDGQLRICKLDEGRCFGSDRPVDTQCARQTA